MVYDTDMSYQLRERNPETLEQMQRNVVSVEANLLAKKSRIRNENKVVFKDEISTSYGKVDILAKSLERIMDRLENMERKKQWENWKPPLIRNPNFRKNPNVGKNGTPDQQIRTPFQENYVEDSQNQEGEDDTQIDLLETKDEDTVFLTQEEHELYMLQQLQLESGESFDFKQGYETTIYEVHKQDSLRSKKNN